MEERPSITEILTSVQSLLGESIDLIEVDGSKVRVHCRPSGSSHTESLSTISNLESENKALKESLTQLQAVKDGQETKVQQLELRCNTIVAENEQLRDHTKALEQQVQDLSTAKDSLTKLEDAVGTNLEALYYKQQLELAYQQSEDQQELAIKLAAAQEENVGLQNEILRLECMEEDDSSPLHTS
ncbi:hypothetical protein NW754_001917 [Fusarium falciforme]|uniref:Uncharacterized protein n=1 Tax=Fusarium falciforme TaxID=195108 RepID=A0A9W8V4F1_9HYPO|nr:hypothetical protein NW754_001917 [Fusarium falciforme]KAJ4195847.1 hypothetical protein NW755_002010 [Fusarium falciforme]